MSGYQGQPGGGCFNMNSCGDNGQQGCCGMPSTVEAVVVGAYVLAAIHQMFSIFGSLSREDSFGDKVPNWLKIISIIVTVVTALCCIGFLVHRNCMNMNRPTNGFSVVRALLFTWRLVALVSWTCWVTIVGFNQSLPTFPCMSWQIGGAKADACVEGSGGTVVAALAFLLASLLGLLSADYLWRDDSMKRINGGGGRYSQMQQGNYMNELSKKGGYYEGSDAEDDAGGATERRRRRHHEKTGRSDSAAELSMSKHHRSSSRNSRRSSRTQAASLSDEEAMRD